MDNIFKSDLFLPLLFSIIITAGGLLLFHILFNTLKNWAKLKRRFIPRIFEEHLRLPGLLFFLVLTLNIDIESLDDFLPLSAYKFSRHALRILLIVSISVLAIKVITVIGKIQLRYYTNKNFKDYTLRSVKTKYHLIERVINIFIIVAALATILMTFEQIKQVGRALLASAGIVGIVLGVAAQKSLAALFAGIQIALSQPIRIDDTVVVENQFGTIGEITLTYVVINTWDEKKLIVPINYFLEKSFVNLTRISSQIIGQVKIYADYTLPVAELRKEFEIWLQHTSLWDKRHAGLVVTGANDKTIEVRATMSAQNAGDCFDLECLIRERLITQIREKYPQCLPTSRVRNLELTPNE